MRPFNKQDGNAARARTDQKGEGTRVDREIEAARLLVCCAWRRLKSTVNGVSW